MLVNLSVSAVKYSCPKEKFRPKIELTTCLAFICGFFLLSVHGHVLFENRQKTFKTRWLLFWTWQQGEQEGTCSLNISRRVRRWLSQLGSIQGCVWLMGRWRRWSLMVSWGGPAGPTTLTSPWTWFFSVADCFLKNYLDQLLHIFQQPDTFLVLNKQGPYSQ